MAPLAYQNGPEIPYFHPTLLLCSSVAAQVHEDTILAAVRPMPTSRPPVLNCSDDISVLPVLLASS